MKTLKEINSVVNKVTGVMFLAWLAFSGMWGTSIFSDAEIAVIFGVFLLTLIFMDRD